MANDVTLEVADIASITQDIIEIFSEGGSKLKSAQIDKVIELLNTYLSKLKQLESEMQIFIKEKQLREKVFAKQNILQSIVDKSSNDYRKAKHNYNVARRDMINEIRDQQYLTRAIALFKEGYKIIMFIRKTILHEEIQYHVAIEGRGNSASRIYTINEEHLLNNITMDTYSLAMSLLSAEQSLAFDMRYNATKKRSEMDNNTILEAALSKSDGSTLWSRGYKVFSTVKEWVKTNSREITAGYGVNFGHFLEAYYAYGGNSANRNSAILADAGFSIKFLQVMLSLQNSDEFYSGGDVGNIQLKSNTATITNIKTIAYAIERIKNIFIQKRTSYKGELKAMFSQQNKNDINSTLVSAGTKEINEHLKELLNAIDASFASS